MNPDFLQNPLELVVLGCGLFFFAGYYLQLSANLCGADQPTFSRAVLIAILTLAAAFLAYDLTGYAIFLATRDELNLNLPAGYSYFNWIKEPTYLKWQVLGLVPGIRYLPVLFGVCLASIVYVLVFKVPYRVSMVIFLLQWTLSLMCLAVLSFFITLTQGTLPTHITPAERAATRPGPRLDSPSSRRGLAESAVSPGTPLKRTLAEYQGTAGPAVSWLKQQADRVQQTLEPYLEPIREATHSYTVHLPVAVQEFLDDGGWWLLLLTLAVVAWLWIRSLYRRLKRALYCKRRKKRTGKKESAQEIDLGFVGEALTELGPVQALVRDRAVRLRLVIMAPAVSYLGDLLPEMAEGLLDYLKPGLGDVVESDTPRIVVWPRQPSESTFERWFFKMVLVPEERGRRSRWILLAGTIRLGRQKVHLGLAVHADVASNLREIRVDKENWEPVLGLQQTKELV